MGVQGNTWEQVIVKKRSYSFLVHVNPNEPAYVYSTLCNKSDN